jgi:hypothetical protein
MAALTISLVLLAVFYYLDQLFFLITTERQGRYRLVKLMLSIIPFVGWFFNHSCFAKDNDINETKIS